MGPVGILVVLGIVGFVGYVLLNLGPGNLAAKFAGAGQLAGRDKAEIINLVGRPTSVSGAPNGGTLLQWISTSDTGGYHIVLLFDADDVCVGVTHEHDGTRL